MSIYDKASLVQIPSGYKASGAKLYSVLPANGDGDFTVSADADATRVNSDGLIESTVANQARLSRNFIDGVVQPDPFLLLETTRTNSITYSEDFSDSSWNKNNATVTSNNTTAPDGSSSADLITSTGTAPYARATFTHSTSTDYCVSIFAKKGDDDYLYIRALALSSQPIASFNLSTGSLGTVNSGLTAEMQNYGNGWYRCIIKYTTTGSITNDLIDFGFASSDNSRFSSSGKFTYFWGAQIETGSYPTSYIPTSGSAVTRTQDDFENSFTGLTSTAATIFLDFETQGLDFNFARLFAVHDSITSDGIYLGIYSTNTIGFFGIDGGAGLPDVKDTISFNERNKLVLAFDGSGNYKYSLNGSLQTGTYVGTSRQYDEIGRGNVIGGSSNNIQIHQIIVFDEVLSDSELETITSYKSFGQMAKALLYTIE